MGTGYITSSKAQIKQRNINKVRKVKQKLSLKQKFRNWLFEEDQDDSMEVSSASLESNRLDSEGMRFQLYRASGGYVLETRYYDRKTDRNENKMYVIRDEQDVGNEIGKIITMESLR